MATSVVMAVTTWPVPVYATVSAAAVAAAAAHGGTGVSGTVAVGGGASGSISEQTGAFTAALPLASLPGRGGAGVELALAYDQAAAGAGVDRWGLGQGIGLGQPFVDPGDGGTLHTSSGGIYQLAQGDTAGTGLKRYLLKDLTFRDAPGTLAGRDGLENVPREYRWVLTYSDGRKNYFSAEGDLIAEEDRYGHQTAYAWQSGDGQHRLQKAVDTFGQAVTFDYGSADQITVLPPRRSDGEQPRTVLNLDGGLLTTVRYPEDQEIRLGWDHTPEAMPGRLLTRIGAPAGAVTRVTYSQPHGFPVASSLRVTDQEGRDLTAERTFRLGAAGEHEGHDYTGRGQYPSADALFDSADPAYRYVTELSDGRSTVRSVFNSLHLLKERTAMLNRSGEPAAVRTQLLEYEGERDNGQTPPAASALPANYGKPVRATVTLHDPASGRSRTTTETARFDEQGRQLQRTDVTGAVTVTAYDRPAHALATTPGTGGSGGTAPVGYGLPLKVTVTGTDGAQTVTENTLTGDRRSIAQVKQSVRNAGEDKLSARTVTNFSTDSHGELTGTTLTWAAGSEAGGGRGPGEITETHTATLDTAAHIRTDTVRNEAGLSSTVTDLVTGHVVKATDTAGRTTETAYDQAGRITAQTAPGGPDGKGLVTTIAYTPGTTTVSSPGKDGKQHITVEHRDLLGRAVKQTDNVHDGELTDNAAARTLHNVTFEDEGRTARVTDRAGRTTTTTSDELGRPVKTLAPNGMTQLTIYADAATADTSTVTTLTLPAGESDPSRASVTTTATADRAGRPVAAGKSFADGSQQSGQTTSYDSLGRTAETVSGDIALAPSYGAGGIAEGAALIPRNTAAFPGEKITAATPRDLTGAPVTKTLTPGQGGEARSGMTLIRDAAGRITEEHRPDGGRTLSTYTPGGKLNQTVSPAGTRTSYRYDGQTGQVTETTLTSADGKTAEKTGYTYDPHTGALTSVYNPDDEIGSRISYTYDPDGHVQAVTYPG
ncbi:hypothetical protein, partial [Streptomyces sp. NPDC096030]|uniref:RHS repeat domain-containing protein n=1 Tax=Streptomyces sp. NPDC096030 TaxID=3155423 RepID=UPI00331E80BB